MQWILNAFIIFSINQPTYSIVPFFSSHDLKYTFGVDHLSKVPKHKYFYPNFLQILSNNETNNVNLFDKENSKKKLRFVDFDGKTYTLFLKPIVKELLGEKVTIVHRKKKNGNGHLEILLPNSNKNNNALLDNCHYHAKSQDFNAAISYCDDKMKGIIVLSNDVYVIHPLPNSYSTRLKRSAENTSIHIVYKRENVINEDFCMIENDITSNDLMENEASVVEDVFTVGQKLIEKSELVVELAIFVDEMLWRHFVAKYGENLAHLKLQEYVLTMVSNIQIMYKEPNAVPQLLFRIVRYEVFMTQPSALASHLHENGHAQLYLDLFCRYQRSLSVQDWDHALLLTGYDIYRKLDARSISGIARLDGMCDPWNTCTLAEGLDFTSAFIGTHELGHSVGMRHDEPFCPSKFIMSTSLGAGKVTWSICSLRDYHSFLQRLDSKRKNCLRTLYSSEKVPLTDSLKPGQLYNADLQCSLMHGIGYIQVSPMVDHSNGICYMMHCGQGSYGRIIASHPALEGTLCGHLKWCQLGRCVPLNDFSTPLNSPLPIMQKENQNVLLTGINNEWSKWSPVNCDQCYCSNIIGSIGLVVSVRECQNAQQQNTQITCYGSSIRAIICRKKCNNAEYTINKYLTEQCEKKKFYNNDTELTGKGTQLTYFPQKACKIFCDVKNSANSLTKNYRFYGAHLPDGTPCGWNRYCVQGECLNLSCNDRALSANDQICPESNEYCEVLTENSNYLKTVIFSNGQWQEWSAWSNCTISCGKSGYKTRYRTCSIENGCKGEAIDKQLCPTIKCPTKNDDEAEWSEWTPWNDCSVSCGRGSQARYRRCQTAKLNIAYSCIGKTMEIKFCDELPCVESTFKLNEWGTWSEWSQCSATCGPGTQIRFRECKKEPCDGSNEQRKACNSIECVHWSEWGNWSQCTKPCGRGLRSRIRLCPFINQCSGSSIDQDFCNEQPCLSGKNLVEGIWSEWTAWGLCSSTCGTGVKRRTRICQSGNCLGNFRETIICNNAPCSNNDATWGGWGYWSQCSKTCGYGIRRRIRKCYGNGFCYGNEFEQENCNLKNC